MRLVRVRVGRLAPARAGDLLVLKTWGTASLIWLSAVVLALAASRWLPERDEQLRQLGRDGATWGVAANAAAMLVAVLWQRRRPWDERAHERAVLLLAFGNVGAVALTATNALLPTPLLPGALPPLLAISLGAGAAAAALTAALPWAMRTRRHG